MLRDRQRIGWRVAPSFFRRPEGLRFHQAVALRASRYVRAKALTPQKRKRFAATLFGGASLGFAREKEALPLPHCGTAAETVI